MELLFDELREMGVGYDNLYKYPRLLTIKQVDKVLDELGCDEGVMEDYNGWSIDWSRDIEFEGMKLHVWGSGYEGTMLFQKEE